MHSSVRDSASSPWPPDSNAMAALVRVELVYDRTCPNVEMARSAIRGALAAIGAPTEWTEWERGTDATPLPLRALGSPTILVNGRDVAGTDETAQPDANSCRVYLDECGCLCGAPTAQQIGKAIEAALTD